MGAHSLSEAFNADDEALLQYLLAVKRHAAAVNKFSEADFLVRIFSKRAADGAHMREELVHNAWDMLDFPNLHNDAWAPEARTKKTETLNLAAFPDLLQELPPELHKAIQDSYHLASTSEALCLDGLKKAMKPYRTERTRRLREVEAAQKAVDLAWQSYKDKYKAREVRLATELGAGVCAETLYRDAAEIPKGASMMVITIINPMPLPFGGFVLAPPAVVPEAGHQVRQADGWLDSWINVSAADDSSTQSHKDTTASGGRAPRTQLVFNMQEDEVQYSGESEDEKNNGYEGSDEATNAARSLPGNKMTRKGATPPTPARKGDIEELHSGYEQSDQKEHEKPDDAQSPPGEEMTLNAGVTPPTPQVEQDGTDRELLVDDGAGGQDGHVTTDPDTTSDNATQPNARGGPRYFAGRCIICMPGVGDQQTSLKFARPLCKPHVRKFARLLERVATNPNCAPGCGGNGGKLAVLDC
ncbi:unnamed protein product, partial [Mesorhabditis spiculigera]